jgi:hypothetical protein
MQKIVSKFSMLFIITLLFGACDSPEKTGQEYQETVIALKGVTLSGDPNEPINRLFLAKGYDGLTNAEFLSSFGPIFTEPSLATEISVIVDMSAGMNIGIDKSYSAMNAMVTNLDPAASRINYYHADDSDVLEKLDIVQSISDAVKLQNPANFKRSYSKLKPALQHATENQDRITVVVTDFLLDEGDTKTPRRFSDGSYKSGESADNTTWAKDYFTSWFAGGHTIEIYPFQYSATNYYSKSETKYIYYMVFIPVDRFDNDVKKMLSSFTRIFDYSIQLAPKKYNIEFKPEALTSCSDTYSTLRSPYNPPHATTYPKMVNIPFSHTALKSATAPIVAACDLNLVNESPFSVTMAINSVDASPFFYDALNKEKSSLDTSATRVIALQPIQEIQLSVNEGNSASIVFNQEVTRPNYLSKYQGLSRLLATKVLINNLNVKELPEELSWNFESKLGTLENNALKESIRLALEQFAIANQEFHLGTIFFSINDK